MTEPGLVIVDKPAGMTSHDVVAKVRRLAGTKRVGHAGTLDPMATGVLVIGVEKATRLLGYLTLSQKEYAATIRLGAATVTDDAEGEVLPRTEQLTARAADLTESDLRRGLSGLTGEIMQVPPQVSAIKVGGQRAYRLTRSGAAPELAARPVTVHRIDLLAVRAAGDMLDLDVEVACSSGTYIRAIARDLGTALRTGGHLTALRRTRVGPYGLSQARTMDQLAESFESIPLARAAAAEFPSVVLDAEQARLVAHGVRLPAGALDAGHPSASSTDPAAAEAVPAEQSSADPGSARVGSTRVGSARVGSARVGSAGPGSAGVSVAGRAVVLAGAAGPVAAFDASGALIALLSAAEGDVRPIVVFVP